MYIISNMLQAFIATFGGGFRGGQYLPTHMTVITRMIWAAGLALMMFLHAWPMAAVVAIFVAIYVTEWLISHAPYQNMASPEDFVGMFTVGMNRGVWYSLALAWWFGHQALWLVPLSAFGLLLSYTMDKFVKSFNIAEEISSFLLWAALAFFTLLPAVTI